MYFKGMCILALSVCMGLTGCASYHKPNVVVYPKHDQTAGQVAKDKMECRAWAEEESGYDPNRGTLEGVGSGAVIGALGGAAAGAIIGAVVGHPGKGAAVGAAFGGVSGGGIGGAKGYVRSQGGYERAYAACMQAKHYIIN